MNQFHALVPESSALDHVFTSHELGHILSEALLNPVSDFLQRPGKNLRSQLVELGYRLSHPKDPKSLTSTVRKKIELASQIVELIHGGSLIVDDIQDSSLVRRDGPAMHIQHGIPIALNAGNWLYFWALTRIRQLDLSPVVEQELTTDVISLMMKAHAGQALDIGTRIDEIDKHQVYETCLASMELKTGTLMSLALRMGSAIAGKDLGLAELAMLGSRLGVLLQMFDDVGNLLGDSSRKFEDLMLRRPTWVWAVASGMENKAYNQFIQAVRDLPDDERLKIWMEKYEFRNHLIHQTELFRSVCEASWETEWKSNHKLSFETLMKFNQILEQAYV